MNNIVKIILGVNIVAGIGGIVVAKFVVQDKMDKLNVDKETAVGNLSTAEIAKAKAEKDLKVANSDIGKKDGDIAKINGKLKTAKDELATAKLRPSEAEKAKAVNDAKKESEDEITKLKKDLKKATADASEVETLKAELADAKQKIKNLTPKGSTLPPDKPVIVPVAGGDFGQIINHDRLNGFYTINRGSDIGIKMRDKFTIYRPDANGDDRAIGKIVITRVRPTASIANFDPALPKPTMPFKVGDKVMKLN